MSDRPEKQKSYTEDEFNKQLVQVMEDAKFKRTSYTIVHGWDRNSLIPSLEIKITGGIADKLEVLSFKIQELMLEYAKGNK